MGEKDEKKSSDVREKIMSYIDIGVAASQKGLKSAGKALSDFGDKSVQRIELTKLKAKEDRAFVKLGKAVYEKLSSKTASVEASDEDLTEILAAIAQLEKDIKKLNGNAKPAAEKAAKTSRAKAAKEPEEKESAKKPAAKKSSGTGTKKKSSSSAAKKPAAKKTSPSIEA
jgi:hypothetical protein